MSGLLNLYIMYYAGNPTAYPVKFGLWVFRELGNIWVLWTARLRTAAMSWYVTPPGANGLLLFLNATENYA